MHFGGGGCSYGKNPAFLFVLSSRKCSSMKYSGHHPGFAFLVIFYFGPY